MTLHVSIPVLICVVLTAAVWIWAFTRPAERSGGYYNWVLSPIIYGAAARIATLAIWLIYFAALALF